MDHTNTSGPTPSQKTEAGTPLAYWQGQTITASDLMPAFIEAAGGQVLTEWLLNQAIKQKLKADKLVVAPQLIEKEQQIMLQSFGVQQQQALILLEKLKHQRGWGQVRFRQMLIRHAGLRLLVQDQVQVTDQAIRDAYVFHYGKQYQVRLITVKHLAQAAKVIRLFESGQHFVDLAIAHSTDASKAQGGLLPWISPVDETFPQQIRDRAAQLKTGQISQPIALETGFGILQLQQVKAPNPIPLNQVKTQLAAQVQRQSEKFQMQKMARQLLASLEITVFDPSLQESRQFYQTQTLRVK